MYYLLLFHYNDSYANASQYDVVRLVIRDGLLREGVREFVSVFFLGRGCGVLVTGCPAPTSIYFLFRGDAVKQVGVFAIRANVISFGNQFLFLKRNI